MTVITEHEFPYKVRWMEEEIILYAEPDRRTVRYSVVDRHTGEHSRKKRVPRALGEDGKRPLESAGSKEGKKGKQVPIYRVPELLIEWAKRHCQQIADERRGVAAEIAARENRTNHVKLGYLFERVRASAWYEKLSDSRLDEVSRVMRWVEAELTYDFDLSEWSGDLQTRLFDKRRELGVKSTTKDGGPTFLPASSSARNTAAKDIKTLKTIFKRALELRYREGSHRELLDSNPMTRYSLPKFGTRRKREIVDHQLYETVLRYCDEVDPSGRFRFFLVLVRWTGERISTIRRLTVGSLLFTVGRIERGFNDQLCNYIRMPADRRKAAKLYAANGGAIYYQLHMRKQSLDEDEGETEQYDAVVPVNPAIRLEFKRFHAKYIRPRGLGREAPLFPGERLDRMISERQVNSWWHDAIRLAEKVEGRDLALSKGSVFHGLRINRRTELRKAELKYARWLVGHSVTNGTPGITVSEGVYLGLKPRDLAAAVLLSDAGEDDEDW